MEIVYVVASCCVYVNYSRPNVWYYEQTMYDKLVSDLKQEYITCFCIWTNCNLSVWKIKQFVWSSTSDSLRCLAFTYKISFLFGCFQNCFLLNLSYYVCLLVYSYTINVLSPDECMNTWNKPRSIYNIIGSPIVFHFSYIWIISILELLAEPYSCILNIHIGFMMALYTSSLLSIDNEEFLSSSQ